MRLFAGLAALAAFVFTRIPPIHAQIVAESLDFDGCIEVDAAEVVRLLNLEISARSTQSSERTSVGVRLIGRCPGDGDVVIELIGTDAGGQPVHAERHFVWQRVEPEARARLLAIGIAEMLPEPPPAPRPEPVPPAKVLPPVPVPTVESTATQGAEPISDGTKYRTRVGAGAAFFQSGPPGLILTGQIAKRVGRRTGVGLSVQGIYSAAESRVGTTVIGDAVLRAAAIGPNFFFESRNRLVHARAQVGLTGGVASLSGQSHLPGKVEGRTVYGFWGGPEVDVAAGFTLAKTWDIDIWLRVAHSFSSIRGRVVDLTTETRGGLWYALGLGLGRGF